MSNEAFKEITEQLGKLNKDKDAKLPFTDGRRYAHDWETNLATKMKRKENGMSQVENGNNG
jgi:hypothetical protein